MVENPGVGTKRHAADRNPRPTVGLDEPCGKCGRPIYFNYQGPVKGICGRCSDGVLAERQAKGPAGVRLVRERVPRAWIWVLVILAFAGGAVVGYLAHDFLPPL